jgi:hypothetical protein
MELTADPHRAHLPETGICVRAKAAGRWQAVDIIHLDAASLLTWLRSRGGKNEWAENTVGILLSHTHSITEDVSPASTMREGER